MGKKIAVAMALLLALAAIGCTGKGDGQTDASDSEIRKVALLINGNLGDRSFHDSANAGMILLRDSLGLQIRVAEVGYDSSRWEPALMDLCDDGYDVIIAGTWQMQEVVGRVAERYPNQRFIIYDTSMDYDADAGNVYGNIFSMEYKQNEGSYLAGVLAASMSETGVLGFVGGMDLPVIRDFLVGFIQGAKAANEDIRIVHSFIGDFSDAAKAKELALAQFQMGVDVVFSVAANAGDGTLQAAREQNRFVIGVDSDQAMLYVDSDPVLATLVVSSVLKRIDQSILTAVEYAVAGTLPWGTRMVMGIAEETVGLADNPIFQSVVPDDVRKLIDEYGEMIKDGRIEVPSAFGMDNATFARLLDSVRL